MTTWLLAGASLLTWLIYLVATTWGAQFGFVTLRLQQSVTAFAFLTLLCNHPHFAASYVLGYGQGLKGLRKHWFTLILLPVSLIALFAWAFFAWDAHGTGFGQYTLGATILAALVHFMLVTSSWHYSQQVFGCILAIAYKKQEAVSTAARRWLKTHLLFLAAFHLGWINRLFAQSDVLQYHSLSIPPLGLPNWPVYGVGVLTLVSGLLAWWHLRKLSVTTLLPWPTFVLWYFPLMGDPIFYLLAVPFFHSLQYLAFALPALKTSSATRNTWLVLFVLVLGWLGFDAFPAIVDVKAYEWRPTDLNFFLMACGLFINIHHFFIDSVIWKRGEGIVERVIPTR